eukprot:UN05401
MHLDHDSLDCCKTQITQKCSTLDTYKST